MKSSSNGNALMWTECVCFPLSYRDSSSWHCLCLFLCSLASGFCVWTVPENGPRLVAVHAAARAVLWRNFGILRILHFLPNLVSVGSGWKGGDWSCVKHTAATRSEIVPRLQHESTRPSLVQFYHRIVSLFSFCKMATFRVTVLSSQQLIWKYSYCFQPTVDMEVATVLG